MPGEAPTIYRSGFRTITDLAFGPEGSLYVLQFATAPLGLGGAGALIRVAPDGTRATISTAPIALFRPTGVVGGPDGAIYVSNRGTDFGSVYTIPSGMNVGTTGVYGEVLRIVVPN
ncbi:MAG: hypothetical protein M3220_18170 [Chloroflexota bacterium]|nr:hypothetical protein [Chloroflexota bacterium]